MAVGNKMKNLLVKESCTNVEMVRMRTGGIFISLYF